MSIPSSRNRPYIQRPSLSAQHLLSPVDVKKRTRTSVNIEPQTAAADSFPSTVLSSSYFQMIQSSARSYSSSSSSTSAENSSKLDLNSTPELCLTMTSKLPLAGSLTPSIAPVSSSLPSPRPPPQNLLSFRHRSQYSQS